MEAFFEFLFKVRPFLYEKGSIAFRPPWPPYFTWLLLAGAIAAAFFLYRRAGPRLPQAHRAVLCMLRCLALAILLTLFLQPVLVLQSVVPQRSFVAVVYDTSRSMEIRDGPGGRARLDIQKELLQPSGEALVDDLARKFRLRHFRFSRSAERTAGYQDAPRHGGSTDIERSIEQVLGELGQAPLAGIVLATDGADNRSADLGALSMRLKARGIPVYTIGVGSPSLPRDAEVVQVTAPRHVLKDSVVEATVAVRSAGYAGYKAKLAVRDRDREITSREIILGGDAEIKTHKLVFPCGPAGPRTFTFRVDPLPDELVAQNNARQVLIRVEDARPEILYVEGEPRWVYGFIRRAAQADENLLLVSLLRQADGKFLRQGVASASTLERGFPADAAELFRYKALILGSVEASFFSFDQLRLISEFVSRRGGGLLMLGGRNSLGQGGYANTPIEDVLPVQIRPAEGEAAPAFQDLEFKLRLTGYGIDHPIMRVSLDDAENRKRWEGAPSLVGFNPTTGLKPGATLLATAATPDGRGQGPALLAFQRFGMGKSLVLATGSTWRWRMEQDHRDDFHEAFWKQLLRWLVRDSPDPVAVETGKQSYAPEEPATVTADVHDPEFILVNNARVAAAIKAPSGQGTSVPMTWEIRREGQYTASFKAVEEGIHEVSVEAVSGDRILGRASANFLIAESNDEFYDAALRSDFLQKLAQDTGGRYYTPAKARSLPEDISYSDRGATQLEEKDLWDMPFFFLLLVSVISAEWLLRKKWGLA